MGQHSASEQPIGRLVCPQIGQDSISTPSNLRECEDCLAQVWVAAGAMTAAVDAGKLAPQCTPCWHTSGRPVSLHPNAVAELAALGLHDVGWHRT